ncbi:hypothetical protein SHIRM173S_08799 [Streptomyces hirsutus]
MINEWVPYSTIVPGALQVRRPPPRRLAQPGLDERRRRGWGEHGCGSTSGTGSSTNRGCTWCPRSSGTGMRLFEAGSAGRRALDVVRVVESPVATHLKYRFVK